MNFKGQRINCLLAITNDTYDTSMQLLSHPLYSKERSSWFAERRNTSIPEERDRQETNKYVKCIDNDKYYEETEKLEG